MQSYQLSYLRAQKMIHTALLRFTCWFEADMIFEGWDVDNAWEVKCSGALDLEDALYKKPFFKSLDLSTFVLRSDL